MLRMAKSITGNTMLTKTNGTYHRNKLLLCTAAAAVSTLPGSCVTAFVVSQSSLRTPFLPQQQQPQTQRQHIHHPWMTRSTTTTATTATTSTRHYSSRNSSNNQEDNNNEPGGGGGILSAVKNVAKSILPSSWFQTEKERQQAIERKRINNEVKGGLTELLKDAPLPIRMVGSLMGPLVSSAMSTMAESIKEQQRTVQDYLGQARLCLENDDAVARILGEPIQVGDPFSQSTSTSSINGKTTSRVELGFPVSGSMSSGVAQLSATEAGIQRLVVQVNGRTLNVSLSTTSTRKRFASRNNNDDDGVIEAEIIEKNTRR